MATLTNTKIKDTYDGLLKTTDNEALDVSGTTLIEDGLGNASALSVGRSGNGVSVSGLLDVTGEVQGTSLDINGAADISGNLVVDTNTLYVDAANNRVGINTLSPDESLELYSNEASVLIANSSGNVNSTSSVKFSNGSTVEPKAAIFFEDTLSNNRGVLHLAVNSNTLGTPVSLSDAKLTIGNGGNVGIGSSTPAANLEVSGNATRMMINTANSAQTVGLLFGLSQSSVASVFSDVSEQNLTFNTGGSSEAMRIDSSGRVSINDAVSGSVATNYNPELLVGGNIVARSLTANEALIEIGGDATSAFITAGKQDGSQTARALRFEVGTSEAMRITSGGYLKASNDGTYYSVSAAVHEMRTDVADDLVTIFSNSNASSPYGIYVVFPNANPNNTTNYFLRCASSSGVTRLFVYSNGNVVNTNNSYGAISDAKLKENIVDASPKLDDLMQVKVRNFNYIGDDKKQLGVVAQELEEVFPSMIDESPDFEEQEVIDEEGNVTTEKVDLGTTTKSVKYSVFVPMLIKAMQEQQEIISDLKARIETLENK